MNNLKNNHRVSGEGCTKEHNVSHVSDRFNIRVQTATNHIIIQLTAEQIQIRDLPGFKRWNPAKKPGCHIAIEKNYGLSILTSRTQAENKLTVVDYKFTTRSD